MFPQPKVRFKDVSSLLGNQNSSLLNCCCPLIPCAVTNVYGFEYISEHLLASSVLFFIDVSGTDSFRIIFNVGVCAFFKLTKLYKTSVDLLFKNLTTTRLIVGDIIN